MECCERVERPADSGYFRLDIMDEQSKRCDGHSIWTDFYGLSK